MTVTTTRQPTPDVKDEFTTADYAAKFKSGMRGTLNQRPAAAVAGSNPERLEAAASASAPPQSSGDVSRDNAAKATAKGSPNQEKVPQQDGTPAARRSYLMDAARWTPGDYSAITPEPLREAVADHRVRSQAMDASAGRFLYAFYAVPATIAGVVLNIVSCSAAKVSALINDPRNSQQATSLNETISLHAERANNIPFTPLKVLYSGYAVPATALSVLLNSVAWLAAHTAVALNDPRRLGRVLLGLLFVALIVGGFTVML